jgi:hypothetical protein
MKHPVLHRWTLGFVVFLILAGCSTSRVLISILEPAELDIPADIQRVSLFPGAGIPQPIGEFDSLTQIQLDPAYDYNRIRRGYMEGMFTVMSTSPRFKRVVLSDSMNVAMIESGKIDWDDLANLCRIDSTEAIFLIRKAVTREYSMSQECGALFVFMTRSKWALYDPFHKLVLADIAFSDTSAYTIADVNCGTDIGHQYMAGVLYDVVNITGMKMGRRFCPNWRDDVPRILISGPETDMHLATLAAIQNRWDEAAATWNRLATQGEDRLASRASFNLAVAWEQGDDLDQAWSWISYADSLRSTAKTQHYKQILAERLKQREILDRQLSGH